ncbi:hypothetical protein C479_00035 [Halovivax asiaticus JCM 14624]|uniref:Uncharacterized protein n=2 Tax=Halovivax asiaticus TaxID=332953 RepID=M0BX44_9EURY|nr:hypothetical protein C479_00035 [Halovivax asiaticus JCM 14624]
MLDKLIAIYETLVERKVINYLALVVGIGLVLYGAYTILGVYAEIWNQLIPGPSETDRLRPILTAFICVIGGLFAIILGKYADFSLSPEPSH